MGGGEVVRYLSTYGSDRVRKAVLVASIIPLVAQKDDNPDGVPQNVFDVILHALKTNRPAFLTGFGKNFYNYSEDKQTVTPEQLHYDWSIAEHASPIATIGSAKPWMDADVRVESKTIKVPALITHGDSDNTVPIATSADQAAKISPNNEYTIYNDGPHVFNVTHAEQLNNDLIAFLS